MISPGEQERRYEELMGKAAMDRQRKEKKERCSYCGARDGKHMNLCVHNRRGKS